MTTKMIKCLIAGCVLLIGTFGSVAYGEDVLVTNTDQLSTIISGERGRPTVIVLFRSGCSLSRNLWPSLIGFASQIRDQNVAFLVFSTDRNKESASSFVSNSDAPFKCHWIEPWSPGQLSSSLSLTGIRIGKTFTLPLVAVIDSSGRVVRQWEGLQNISEVGNALKSIGAL